MKHTPGPWSSVNGLVVCRAGTIASVPYSLAQTDAALSALEGQANARLIAAAPELLDALEKLLTISELAEYYMPGELAENATRVSRDIESARTVIAKATGERDPQTH
jgi:hypothetical protein